VLDSVLKVEKTEGRQKRVRHKEKWRNKWGKGQDVMLTSIVGRAQKKKKQEERNKGDHRRWAAAKDGRGGHRLGRKCTGCRTRDTNLWPLLQGGDKVRGRKKSEGRETTRLREKTNGGKVVKVILWTK